MPSVTKAITGQVEGTVSSTKRDENFQYMLEQTYSKDDIELKTDLNVNLINALARGKLYAKTFQSSLMADLCQTVMELRVSNKRQGRKEFSEIARSHNSVDEEKGLSSKLFGG